MDKASEEWQQKMKTELEKLDKAQKEYSKSVAQRKVLEGQLNENKGVCEELALLKSDNQVYKMIGPVLVQQEHNDVKINVNKRIEYITQEIARQDKAIGDINKRIEAHTITLSSLQKLKPVSA